MFILPLTVKGELVIVRALPVSVIPTLVNPVLLSDQGTLTTRLSPEST